MSFNNNDLQIIFNNLKSKNGESISIEKINELNNKINKNNDKKLNKFNTNNSKNINYNEFNNIYNDAIKELKSNDNELEEILWGFFDKTENNTIKLYDLIKTLNNFNYNCSEFEISNVLKENDININNINKNEFIKFFKKMVFD